MMNVDFHSGHIETLCDLKTIAEKHNCKISFGVRSYSENIIDEGLLKQEGFTDDEINYIKDSLNVVDACTTNCSMYFELIEKDSNKVNSLVDEKTLNRWKIFLQTVETARVVYDNAITGTEMKEIFKTII